MGFHVAVAIVAFRSPGDVVECLEALAALTHTDPAGTKDIDFPSNVRSYFLAGTQHGPAAFPPSKGAMASSSNQRRAAQLLVSCSAYFTWCAPSGEVSL